MPDVIRHLNMNRILFTIFFTVLFLAGSFAQKTNIQQELPGDTLPKPLDWVSDYEHIFTTGQAFFLDSIIRAFEKETTNEIAIVTIDSSWTTIEYFDSLVLSIANKWGVGKPGQGNGIVIGISTGLKRIRIVNGYSIQTKLTDADTKRIIDDIIVPEFKMGSFFRGTEKGLLAIMQNLR
jgi:uncharacterized protein